MDVHRDYDRDPAYARVVLMCVYVELSMPSGSDDEAQMALTVARVAAAAMLRHLAVDVADPQPWLLFLRRILAPPESQEKIDAFEKLYEVAQSMLAEQGLFIRPEDLGDEAPLERRLCPCVTSPF